MKTSIIAFLATATTVMSSLTTTVNAVTPPGVCLVRKWNQHKTTSSQGHPLPGWDDVTSQWYDSASQTITCTTANPCTGLQMTECPKVLCQGSDSCLRVSHEYSHECPANDPSCKDGYFQCDGPDSCKAARSRMPRGTIDCEPTSPDQPYSCPVSGMDALIVNAPIRQCEVWKYDTNWDYVNVTDQYAFENSDGLMEVHCDPAQGLPCEWTEISDCDVVVCTGQAACKEAEIIRALDVECNGRHSCKSTYNVHGGFFNCFGEESCVGSYVAASYADPSMLVDCVGHNACMGLIAQAGVDGVIICDNQGDLTKPACPHGMYAISGLVVGRDTPFPE